jgi:hypothetical protein
MPSYHVVFTGHLDKWRLPPTGSTLPEQIVQVYNVDVKNESVLSSFIDGTIGNILQSGGMKAYEDPYHISATGLIPSITVPVHMLTHLTWKATPMVGEQPLIKGEEIYNKSGKEVVKQ